MTDTWDFSPDGYPPGAVTFTGTVLFPAGIDAAKTGAGMMVFGPGGAAANFPAVREGPPGLSPDITFSTVQLAWNAVLPTVNPVVTVTDPGTYGTRSKISVVFYQNAGEPGPATSFAIGLADDIVGGLADGINLLYDAGQAVFRPALPKVGPTYSLLSIPASGLSTTPQRTLTAMTIPKQPWDWTPEVLGEVIVINAVDTRADVVAYLNSVGGNVVGRARGAGGGAGNVTQTLIPSFGTDMPDVGGYGKVLANQQATIFLRVENQVSSNNQWATGAASLTVKVNPVP